MPKAKDYANEYRTRIANGETQVQILSDFQCRYIEEVNSESKTRRLNDVGLIDVFKEQDQKWRSMSRYLQDQSVPASGFLFGIFSIIPDMYDAASVRGFLDSLDKTRAQEV